MPTPLDDVLETHDGPEPRVVTADVQEILRKVIRPNDEEGNGAAVSLVAERARVSTRTVYRVLNPGEAKVTISLDLADRLCIAAGSHVSLCHLAWPDGALTDYPTLRGTLPDNLG